MSGERTISRAQISLSAIFLIGYFAILGAFLLGFTKVPLEWKDTFQTLLGVLTAGVGTILGFWFSRSRGGNDPPVNQGDGA